jgi:hypothetical protein
MPEAKVIDNPQLKAKVEQNLGGRPVLAMLELPMAETEKRAVEALNLEEGAILSHLDISTLGEIGAHSWSCSVSVPPDCSVDIDG